MHQFALGENKPLWGHFSMPDIFADAFIDAKVRAQEKPSPPFHLVASSISLIVKNILFAGRLSLLINIRY